MLAEVWRRSRRARSTSRCEPNASFLWEEPREALRRRLERSPQIALVPQECWDVADREVLGAHVLQVGPVDRERDRGPRSGARRVGGNDVCPRRVPTHVEEEPARALG